MQKAGGSLSSRPGVLWLQLNLFVKILVFSLSPPSLLHIQSYILTNLYFSYFSAEVFLLLPPS